MESDAQTSEVTQQEGPTQEELVDVHEASDEDLKAYLEREAALDSESEEQQPQAEPQQEQKQEAEQPKETPVAEPPKPQTDYQAIQKQLEGLELHTRRRVSEFGEVKKQLRQFIDNASQGLDEKFLESPTQALAQARQIEAAQQKLQETEAEEQSLINAHQAQVLLHHHLGADGVDLDAIGESLASDGLPQEFIQSFKANPYQAALPETLVQLGKRAAAEKKVKQMEAALAQLVPYTQKLLDERKNLPQNVLGKVQSALKQSPQVTGSAAGTGQVSGTRAVDPTQMTDEEIAEFLKNNR